MGEGRIEGEEWKAYITGESKFREVIGDYDTGLAQLHPGVA